MPNRPRVGRIALAALAGTALLAAGCSPATNDDTSASGKTVVTFRLWDEEVKKAYDESFAAFEKENSDIDVKIEVVPWNNYFTKLPADVSSGNVADIFWTNTSNFGLYADNGSLLDVDSDLAAEKKDWQQSVVDLYTRKDKVWGVPQLWDSIALFYNKDLVSKAKVDPAALTWNPSGDGDTFLPAARKLTVDANGVSADQPGFDPKSPRQYGFNAAYDGQAIYWNFIGQNGGVWQDGDEFAFDSAKNDATMQYVVDLINKHHVAPSAADTNDNTDKTRDLFVQGRMALFQSGPYNLKAVDEGASFDWGIAPLPQGPAGEASVVHGVAAVASAKTEHPEETRKVLKWLGTEEGQRPIAEGGYAFPGVTSAQSAYVDYWKEKGVDIQPFLDAAEGTTVPGPSGPRVQAGTNAIEPILKEMFLGRKPVEDALKEGQQAGNEAIEG